MERVYCSDGDPFFLKKTDPYPYLLKYSSDVLKWKIKVLDLFNTDKKCFLKIYEESRPEEIWIRIRFTGLLFPNSIFFL